MVDGLVSVAPAISRFASGLNAQPRCPWLIAQGDQDELVDVEETVEWVDGLEPGPELLIIPGGEHFFHGRLLELREAVSEFGSTHTSTIDLFRKILSNRSARVNSPKMFLTIRNSTIMPWCMTSSLGSC